MNEVIGPTMLQEVWSGDSPKGTYKIIRVSKYTPFDLVFDKPNAGIKFDMSPESPEGMTWTVEGVIDTDIIANLGFEVESSRQGLTPPVMSEGNIMAIRKRFSGAIARNETNPDLWDIQLHVPVNNIYRFIDTVWHPRSSETPHPRGIWHLTRPGLDYRDVPEKKMQQEGGAVSLTVIPRV